MEIDFNGVPKIAFEWLSDSKRLRLNGPTCKCLHSNGPFKSAYGQFDLLPGGIYCWEVEAIKGTNFKIGVMKKKDDMPFDKAFSDDKDGFAFYSMGQLRNGTNTSTATVNKDYGKCFGNKDVVGVYLDMTKGYLAYFLNGEFQGPAYMTAEFKEAIYVPAVAVLIEDEEFCVVEVCPED